MTLRRRSPLFPTGLLALAWVVLASSGAARADGAFPDEFSIHFPPDALHRIYLGANFGLLVTEDDGATWRYSCEPWVVAGSNAALAANSVSMYQVTADGALLAASITVTRSSDVACTWPTVVGSIAGQYVPDLFPDPNDKNFVLAIVVVVQTGGSYLVASHDGGRTFDAPRVYDSPDLLTGVEIARSKPGVVYATSVSTTGGAAKFLASTDSGATWPVATTLAIQAATEPRILGVDPADEKKVYVRIVGATSDSIWMTEDGGQTFKVILPPITGQFSSFLRATDGALYAGTRAGKLYVQPAGTTGFSERSAPHLRCLGQRPGTARIYGCGDLVLDGFSLATSDDNGATFQPMMSFTQLLGPLSCAPVQTNCAAHWDRIQGVLGIARADAGQTDAGGGGTPTGGGSHCATAGVDGWTLWLAVGLISRRRKRASRRVEPPA
ncbi:MAG: WD40/YVTN/BNR-like repeat-containing protein [Myxococcales bacterium]